MRRRALTVLECRMTLPPGAEFERVVLPHLDAANNLARWLMRDAVLAEDVVQDAVLRALGYCGTYRGGNTRAWLLRIVRNTAHTALAAGRRRMTTSLDGDTGGEPAALQVPDPAHDPEAALLQREDVARLGCRLAALPPELRECVVLRELEELSYKQIAYVTDTPIGTVMSRLWRARRALLRSGDGETA
ncbi:MAG: hypothetical protein NVS2B11_00970 [Acetobacteraceae bacterium]